ncbi:hypothetical protein [endosymbiont of unidentified scaly snail isolate Monju]|uniref:hypothetical protein n=1 Tax=endosymbiont of unidentified scaly snail isolate Monju TaxID=1248727 RepID=UPI0003891B0F|nr:hypothetical protein [endosymbiont of unidentified scaly snail isolate Monju]BAN69255.1 hypothetical protein EBS_1362 [endosymbiont of unidentified scaly snail isolate Monju]
MEDMRRLILLTFLMIGIDPAMATGLDARFGKHYLEGAPVPAGSAEMQWKKALATSKRYNRLLSEISPFKGVYLRLEGNHNLDSGRDLLRYGLDWDLFANGRREAQRRHEKTVLERRVQFLQLLRDMSERAAQERHYLVDQLRTRVLTDWLKAKVQLVEQQLAQLRGALRAGFATREQVEQLRLLLKQTRERLQAQPDNTMAMPASWQLLLNQLTELQLKPHSELLARTLSQHPDLALQRLFQQRADFQRDWKDDLEARLYIERNETAASRTDQGTVIGFRVRMPLERPAHREELVRLERSLYEDQVQAIRTRLRQRIDQIIRRWHQHRAILKAHLYHLNTLERSLSRLARHARMALPSLPYSPDAELRVKQRERLDLLRDILMERLQLLDYLVDLGQLAQLPDPRDLFTETDRFRAPQ